MNKKIAILRGINVGGKRKILMADLRTICEKMGWKAVKTYIQSGNIVFEAKGEPQILEKAIENAIRKMYGFDVPVIIRSFEELQTAVSKNPYFTKKPNIQNLHLTFLKETPANENAEKIKSRHHENDQFIIDGKVVFLYCEGKYHQSKFTNNYFEKILKVSATTRNWKTVLALNRLSESI